MINQEQTYFSNGKLLLSGEYAVLNGATAFALPVNMGQTLEIKDVIKTNILRWEAYVNNKLWFFADIDTETLSVIKTNIKSVAERLIKIIIAGIELNVKFKNKLKSKIITNLNFNRNWGLGTSSTLISNIAYWAEIDPFSLFNSVFDGSGYDIAAARISKPFLYTSQPNSAPVIEEVNFEKEFLDSVFFVYLGKKQNSGESIKSFRKNIKISDKTITEISNISKEFTKTSSLSNFKELMNLHEQIMSKVLSKPTIKSKFFNDFDGSIKSLGAWGGDFIMLATERKKEYIESYFNEKNLTTIFSYKELIIK